jgi:hypothetical protein
VGLLRGRAHGPEEVTDLTPLPKVLEPVVHSLADEFTGRIPTYVVRDTVVQTYEGMAATATVKDFLPIFTQRNARNRLADMAGPMLKETNHG